MTRSDRGPFHGSRWQALGGAACQVFNPAHPGQLASRRTAAAPGDADEALRAAEQGFEHVNHGTVPDSHMPFGGIGHSSAGAHSLGTSAQALYTTEHVVRGP